MDAAHLQCAAKRKRRHGQRHIGRHLRQAHRRAAHGYVISDVLVDGKSVGRVSQYTVDSVNKGHTIAAQAVPLSSLLGQVHDAYIVGYPDGTVRLSGCITRAEAATIFYRLLSADAQKQYEQAASAFADANGNWYSTAVATLSNIGVLAGYPDGSFRPDAQITRAEFTAIAARFVALSDGGETFPDVPSSHWAYELIAAATNAGWITGYPDGTFRPENRITRAEAVKITNALLQRAADRDFIVTNPGKIASFPDLHTGEWSYFEILEAATTHDYSNEMGKELWAEAMIP